MVRKRDARLRAEGGEAALSTTGRRNVVTGRTAVIPLVGHPVEQVKSPGPMNRWFDDNGVDAVVVPGGYRVTRLDHPDAFAFLCLAPDEIAGGSHQASKDL